MRAQNHIKGFFKTSLIKNQELKDVSTLYVTFWAALFLPVQL